MSQKNEWMKESVEKRFDMPINDKTELRKVLIARCEKIILTIVEQLCAGRLPSISYRVSTIETLMDQVNGMNIESLQAESMPREFVQNTNDFALPEFMDFERPEQSTTESVQKSSDERRTVVDFACRCSRTKLVLMMTILARVHRLLIENGTQTRRSLFYDLKSNKLISESVTEQRQIDEIVQNIANLLECAPWDTGLVATAKGLASGNLSLTLENDFTIDYDVPGGVLIPQIVSNVISIRSKADLVIVVEKDAVFQQLLVEECPRLLNCILITGKGYPDVTTRMLVKILAEQIGLPVYILVDADPYGVEIMCTYKYGSISLSREQGSLACPSAHWIGVHPSELVPLGIPKIPLTDADLAKLESLKSRPYIDKELSTELDIMRKGKAEIEGMASNYRSFLTSVYLPSKTKSWNTPSSLKNVYPGEQ